MVKNKFLRFYPKVISELFSKTRQSYKIFYHNQNPNMFFNYFMFFFFICAFFP